MKKGKSSLTFLLQDYGAIPTNMNFHSEVDKQRGFTAEPGQMRDDLGCAPEISEIEK